MGHDEARSSDKEYLALQDIPRLLDEAVCSLMKDRPEDALDFLSTHFKTLAGERAAARSCNGNGGSDKAAPAAAAPATAEAPAAAAAAAAPAGEACPETSSPTSPTAANAADGAQKRRVKEITARACVVCGRDDRAGEVRSAGFKCTECIGQPSGKFIRKDLETSEKLMKGRDEEGMFVINDYTILANLGEGAYGKVRLCVHNQSQQSYAVKFLSKETLGGNKRLPRAQSTRVVSANNEVDKCEVDKAKEEVKIMAKLSHPNVCKIYGVMESDQELLVVMEFLEGGQVFPEKYPCTPLPTTKLQKYAVAIARGLEHLHDNGVIHRDIKPANILLDRRGNLKLADFGVSAQVNDTESFRVTGFVGTPYFISPEAFTTEGPMSGEATDVWAFAVTLYTMAFGMFPWPEKLMLQELGEHIQKSEPAFTHANESLNDLLRGMFHKDPETRLTVEQILRHPFLSCVRIVKGQPVETLSVGLTWAGDDCRLAVRDKCDDDEDSGCGRDLFTDFFDKSAADFQITQGNAYSITLYDKARDPRRRTTATSLHTACAKKVELAVPKTWETTGVTKENWDDDDLEDEMF